MTRSRAAFIFDIDGTIIDSMPFHARSWDVFAERHGLAPMERGFFHRTAGRTAVELMRDMLGARPDDELRALVREKESIYRELFAAQFREIPGFVAFARAAKSCGVRVACATAGDPENIAFALAHLGMSDFFHAAVGAHDVARGKPHPDLFLLAANRIGVPATDCVVFEDAPLGIEAAQRAGMHAVAITSTVGGDDLAGPHVVACAPDFTQLDPYALLDRIAA